MNCRKVINNGNWDEWRTIWAEIIRMISNSNKHAARVQFEITSMSSNQNCLTRGSITTLLHPFWNRQNTELSQFKYFFDAVLNRSEIKFIHFWGWGGKQVTVVVCFHQCLKTENIKIKRFAILVKIIVKKNCNNLVNLNISFKKSLIHQHTFWKVLLTIGSFRQNIHAACRIVKEVRCWTRRDTPIRRRLKTIFKCSIVVKKCDLILSTSEIGQFPIRLTVIKENTCIC